MPHFVRVELSDETAALLGDLTTATGAPAAELVRKAVEARYGGSRANRQGPHRPSVPRVRRVRKRAGSEFDEYGGEG